MSVTPKAAVSVGGVVCTAAVAAAALYKLGEETKNGTSTPGTTRLYDPGSCAGGQLGQRRLSEASTHLAVKGIKNLGNTCFLNAVLQSLGSFPIFREYLEELKALSAQPRGTRLTQERDSPFTFELLNLMNDLKPLVPVAPRLAPIDATKLRRILGNEVGSFGKGNQQDAQELFQMVMRLLGEEAALCLQRNETLQKASEAGIAEGFGLLSLTQKPDSKTIEAKDLPKNPLLGSLFHLRHCRGCQEKSLRKAEFINLSLTLPQARNQKFGAPVKLEEVLEEFTQQQLVEDVECPSCAFKAAEDAESGVRGKRVPADMRMMLGKPPKTLCLHFQRRHQNSSGSVMKLEQRVVFPPNLNLTPFCCAGGSYTDNIGVQKPFHVSTITSGRLLAKASPGTPATPAFKALQSPQTLPVQKQPLVGGSVEGANAVGGRKGLNGLPNVGARTGGSSVSGSVEEQDSMDGSLSGNEERMDYDLRAVIVHRGGTDSGHYTAFRKLESDQEEAVEARQGHARVSKASDGKEEWVYISDEDVERGVSESRVLKSQAYMLFYRKAEVFNQGVS